MIEVSPCMYLLTTVAKVSLQVYQCIGTGIGRPTEKLGECVSL